MVSWSSSQQLLLLILNDHIATPCRRCRCVMQHCHRPLYSAMPYMEPSAASHSLQFTSFHSAFNLGELQEQEVFGFFVISAGN